MLKDQIQQDLKTALLAGDKAKAEILRGLKSAILYEEVAKGAREAGLSGEALMAVIAREAKKRNESAELYQKAGETERADKELAEKSVIEGYLPQQLSDDELLKEATAVINQLSEGVQIGPAIAAVRSAVGARADSARIAATVKQIISTKNRT